MDMRQGASGKANYDTPLCAYFCPSGRGWVCSEQVQAALIRGHLDEADAFLRRSLELRQQVGDQSGIAIDLCASARVALRRGDSETASNLIQRAELIAITVKERPEQARIWLVRGLVAAARGNSDRAEACYRASLSIASELGIRREMAQAQELLGRLLAERQDLFEGRQLLAQAEENYSHLGVPAATRVREIMVQLGGAAGD